MSDLSSETRGLLDRARGGDAMPRGHRKVLRRRLALALGVAAPTALSTTALASAALWAARGLAVVGAAGLVHLAVPGRSPEAAPAPRPVRAATAMVQSANTLERRAPLPTPPEAPPFMPVPSETLPVPTPSEARPVPMPSEARPVPSGARPARLPGFGLASVAHPSVPIAPQAPIGPRTAIVTTDSPGDPIHGPSPREDSLAAEVRLLGDARLAIAGSDGSRALDLLAEHARLFPGGALTPEASALRVDALCAAGRTDAAAVEASRFEARYPGSPLARRFASTCARRARGPDAR